MHDIDTFLEKPRQQVLEAQAELDSLSRMRKQACRSSALERAAHQPKIQDSIELEEDVFGSRDFFSED